MLWPAGSPYWPIFYQWLVSTVIWKNFLPGALCWVPVWPLLNQSWEGQSDGLSCRQRETNREELSSVLRWHVFIDASLWAAAFSSVARSIWQLIQVCCLILLSYCWIPLFSFICTIYSSAVFVTSAVWNLHRSVHFLFVESEMTFSFTVFSFLA